MSREEMEEEGTARRIGAKKLAKNVLQLCFNMVRLPLKLACLVVFLQHPRHGSNNVCHSSALCVPPGFPYLPFVTRVRNGIDGVHWYKDCVGGCVLIQQRAGFSALLPLLLTLQMQPLPRCLCSRTYNLLQFYRRKVFAQIFYCLFEAA
jgi:hypothetical protein